LIADDSAAKVLLHKHELAFQLPIRITPIEHCFAGTCGGVAAGALKPLVGNGRNRKRWASAVRRVLRGIDVGTTADE
jgi:hypothetical protein